MISLKRGAGVVIFYANISKDDNDDDNDDDNKNDNDNDNNNDNDNDDAAFLGAAAAAAGWDGAT